MNYLGFLIAVLVTGALALIMFSVLRGRRQATDSMDSSYKRGLYTLLRAMPVPDWIGQPQDQSDLKLKLLQSGLDLKPAEYLGLRWLLILLGFLLTGVLLFAGNQGFFYIFLATGILISSWWLPPLWLRWKTEARLQRLDHALPDLMDRLQLSLEAGLSFELSLRRAVKERSGLLAVEVMLALAMLDRGHTKEEAFDRLTVRNPSQDISAFTAAIKQAENLGTSLTDRLQVQGELLRARRRRKAQEASRRLPILIVFPLVFFFLPALLIIYLGPPLLHILLGQ